MRRFLGLFLLMLMPFLSMASVPLKEDTGHRPDQVLIISPDQHPVAVDATELEGMTFIGFMSDTVSDLVLLSPHAYKRKKGKGTDPLSISMRHNEDRSKRLSRKERRKDRRLHTRKRYPKGSKASIKLRSNREHPFRC